MLKLYGVGRSRAAIVQWYLEELTIPYEFIVLDMQAGDLAQPTFLAINPFAKVPAIVDGDLTLWESGAILMYLAEKYGHVDSVETRRRSRSGFCLPTLRSQRAFSLKLIEHEKCHV